MDVSTRHSLRLLTGLGISTLAWCGLLTPVQASEPAAQSAPAAATPAHAAPALLPPAALPADKTNLPKEMTPEGVVEELVEQTLKEVVEANTNPQPVPVPLRSLTPVQLDVLNKDLLDLADLLAGRWDNELQTFFEPELNIPPALRHERLHVAVKPLTLPEFGPVSFYAEYRKGGEAGAVVRQRIWTLSVDKDLGAVRMTGFAPKDGKPLEGLWQEGKIAPQPESLKKEAFTPVPGCDIIWRRQGEGFAGSTRPAACKLVTNADKRVLSVSEQHIVSAGLWEVRDVGVDERGVRVFGGAESPPTRLRRAQTFTCWASVPKGNDRVFATDLVLHDQGGVATARFEGGASVRVRLRNVDWPIGQNRPSLTLYLLDREGDRASGYAWGEPLASRLALDVGGIQVSCTRDPRAQWR
ncbi:chromophore lyase CpcT/CpeT [Candidatus Phycosocius bacilliformis]|uniref:Chromophore lyase CpcT/CpeT n=1 Tax=Candidatus Phycosocius bacilliformis TaxID=1445552 RepID=A0A2P2EB25_9PROT|nr:chromophore lyase CpcT/CpeT [Candidatus Phycosocius bacilliformis]GBF58252.1 chromophore lyase CpcT/CpeT [Candidatus Phycosocius bacilliformis]